MTARHILTVSIAALIAAQPVLAQMKTEIGEGEGQLDIVAWPGYIERGETAPEFDWVTAFEDATGCSVNVKTANTSDEMVALMNEGGFDLVTASGDASLRLIAGEAGSADQHRADPVLGQRRRSAEERALAHRRRRAFRRPLHVGAERADVRHRGLWRHRTDVVERRLRADDICPTASRTRAECRPMTARSTSPTRRNYLMYHQPDLGITSPYELNQAQYEAALDLLRQQRTLVSRYWHDAFIQMDDFKNEGVVASGSWPFQVNILTSEGEPIASVIPQEGATGWADTTMMHIDAAHPNCAYKWMEHSLASNLQSDLSVWFGAVPSVPSACTDGRGMQTAEGCTANGLDDFDRIRFWTTPVSSCESQGECVPYYRWVVGLYRRDRRALTRAFS